MVCILSVVVLLAFCSLSVFADPHVVPDDSTTDSGIIFCTGPWPTPDID
ncbi:MAG: hypothetical protein KAX49_02485 [Halanaerobiales bacterium]|nr:hypothetical protein [Halanaerobiales bacterium]